MTQALAYDRKGSLVPLISVTLVRIVFQANEQIYRGNQNRQSE